MFTAKAYVSPGFYRVTLDIIALISILNRSQIRSNLSLHALFALFIDIRESIIYLFNSVHYEIRNFQYVRITGEHKGRDIV